MLSELVDTLGQLTAILKAALRYRSAMDPPVGAGIEQIEWLECIPDASVPPPPRSISPGVGEASQENRAQTGVTSEAVKEGLLCPGNGGGVPSATATSSGMASGGIRKPPCRYGRGCSHNSSFHRSRYSHPTDVTEARQGRPRSGAAGSTSKSASRSSTAEAGPRSSDSGTRSGDGGGGAPVAPAGVIDAKGGDAADGFMCNECGMDFASVKELQLHMIRKTAWSNQGLIGCRVSCLVDNREWHEGLVTQVRRALGATREGLVLPRPSLPGVVLCISGGGWGNRPTIPKRVAHRGLDQLDCCGSHPPSVSAASIELTLIRGPPETLENPRIRQA